MLWVTSLISAGCGPMTGFAAASLYTLVDLGTLSDGPLETRFSFASSLDGRGRVTGYSGTTTGDTHAFLFDGTMHDLGTLGGLSSIAYGFDAAGDVVGYSTVGSGELHRFSYDGTMHDLGPASRSYGLSLTQVDGATTVGGIPDASGYLTAYLDDGTLRPLGTLGGRSSYALGFNEDGSVVGYSATTSGAQHAFLYQDGVMTDLNGQVTSATGWILQSAKAINTSGQIVGFGTYEDQSRAFLLNLEAVPEAGTVAGAVAVALATGAAWLRGRRRS
jgi:probable HAF family extracellular repeat protein